MSDLIPTPITYRIYDVLVEHAGAPDGEWDYWGFRQAHATGKGCREYRFCGSLGFGGKFRNDGRPWRVDCYREDETPERLKAIEATNAALLVLWNAVSLPTPAEPATLPPSP